ncbi:TPA: DUF4286 family protein [Burkholderia cenocepacia]|uniref:Uncharacterized protein n=1 Tax=Burkholderia latens TaxID=488446 RepID=A0A6H9T9K8_9BURK|nr:MULTISPECIES: DUF4286 family protein [Burkholderia]KAB0644498.1 hypothetical protein F7R21_01460 [Burkholderia latens]MBJ9924399.1 hypothetical protein [Burkholderia cenocepacia]UJH78788.1 hypothetical protein L0U95_37035 [Burkholderia cenocepacia]VWB23641.1 hypothetical protein BLA24064_00952 [Burkholderia latens]HDR9882394.1 hypothetical protein [Burkholderia cenocepacia]
MEPRGLLFVASDVDAQDEEDFNRWYDSEHLEDRVRMDGVLSASRYVAVSGGRRYLALYWARAVSAFDSPAYAHAFRHQTPWSIDVLSKMRSPVRRIGTLHAEIGKGSGGWLAILQLGMSDEAERLIEQCIKLGHTLSQRTGFVRSYLLLPNDELSRPLPLEDMSCRQMRPILIIESSSASSSESALQTAINALNGSMADTARYCLAWNLDAKECA